ncbi:MAG: SET domain-containing protein [Chitinophagales bacterium]
MILPSLYIAATSRKGRGVFAGEALVKGTLIEVSPVIVMSKDERILLDQTLLHDYIFLWGKNQLQCCVALGYLSLYNHDYQANCDYEMEFDEAIIRVTTVRDVPEGAELCINYNGNWNDPRRVWFDKLSIP